MGRISGGDLLVRTLQRAGVEQLFGLHGAHVDPIFQACLDRNLPILDTRHEVAAGHAAEGYSRAADRLGVALVTAGPGFTNVVTSIANAFLDRGVARHYLGELDKALGDYNKTIELNGRHVYGNRYSDAWPLSDRLTAGRPGIRKWPPTKIGNSTPIPTKILMSRSSPGPIETLA